MILFEALLVLSVFSLGAVTLKDLGAPGWGCHPAVMAKNILKIVLRSPTEPKSVHALRYADIEIIGAIGDSITAGSGAGAHLHDYMGVFLQYRGLSFSVGGDHTLDTHVTLANILKKFNPNLFGFSTGQCSDDVWDCARFNAAVPGAVAGDLLNQAELLVSRMQNHPEVDAINKWKLIHIFIGGNDLCAYCKEPNVSSTESPTAFRDNIRAAIQYFKDTLPKTVVVLTGMLDLTLLRRVDQNALICKGIHLFECGCEMNTQFTNDELRKACHEYMTRQQELQTLGIFDTSDDFTLVVQPFFEGVTAPPLLSNGSSDLSFFAPDCFHFSQFGHAVVAKFLWNNLLQPVGAKSTHNNFTDFMLPLHCPQAVNF